MRMMRGKMGRMVAVGHVLWGLAAGCSDASVVAKDAGASGPDAQAMNADGPAAGVDSARPDGAALGVDGGGAGLDGSTIQGDAALQVDWRDGAVNDGTAAMCVGPENTAPPITETVVPDPPPVAKGGTIEPGLYYETSWIRYNGLAVPPDAGILTTHRQTTTIESSPLRLNALRMTVSTTSLDTGDPMVFIIDFEHSAPSTPTTLAFSFICPQRSGVPLYDYDATPESVTFYHADTFSPYSYTITKQ